MYFSWRLTYTGGFMVHQWDLRLGHLADYFYVSLCSLLLSQCVLWLLNLFFKVGFMATLMYILTSCPLKIAILLDFTALFVPRGIRNYFFWISYVTAGMVLLWNVIGFIVINVSCSPYEGNWDPFAPNRTCHFSTPDLTIVSATLNFAFDLVPLILPQKIIWGLKTTVQKKLGVSIVFLVGILYVIPRILTV